MTHVLWSKQMRHDTPFRILVRAPKPARSITHDYNLGPDGLLGPFPLVTHSFSASQVSLSLSLSLSLA